MDSALEVVADLRSAGFEADIHAGSGRVICGDCGARSDPSTVRVERVHRFEGASNPDDELIIFAVRLACGHAGTYVSAYGPDTPLHDTDVIRQLPPTR